MTRPGFELIQNTVHIPVANTQAPGGGWSIEPDKPSLAPGFKGTRKFGGVASLQEGKTWPAFTKSLRLSVVAQLLGGRCRSRGRASVRIVARSACGRSYRTGRSNKGRENRTLPHQIEDLVQIRRKAIGSGDPQECCSPIGVGGGPFRLEVRIWRITAARECACRGGNVWTSGLV